MNKLMEIIVAYFARRNPVRLAIRGAIFASVLALAHWVVSPEGQAVLAASLGSYAWVAPVITALAMAILAMSNGKEPSSA